MEDEIRGLKDQRDTVEQEAFSLQAEFDDLGHLLDEVPIGWEKHLGKTMEKKTHRGLFEKVFDHETESLLMFVVSDVLVNPMF